MRTKRISYRQVCQQLQTGEIGADLGARVRDARARRNWSLREVSTRTGLSRAYINAIEHGRSRRPGADAMRRLEDVLGPLMTPVDLEGIPSGLADLARTRNLPASEVHALASLHVAGRRPESRERWRFIYDAILASERMDAPFADGVAGVPPEEI